MRPSKLLSIASAAGLAAALSACGAPEPFAYDANYPAGSATGYQSGAYPAQPVAAVEYGRITGVQMVSAGTTTYNNENRGAAGSVIGAVVGGLLGNTIGGGSGRAAATVLGAVGGAVVGNNIARNSNGGAYAWGAPVYRVTVQTDSGQWRNYDVAAQADLRVGDRVRIENGLIYLG
jgi:outer membrane lipoprotein SlyB